jgi:hypothetical protein
MAFDNMRNVLNISSSLLSMRNSIMRRPLPGNVEEDFKMTELVGDYTRQGREKIIFIAGLGGTENVSHKAGQSTGRRSSYFRPDDVISWQQTRPDALVRRPMSPVNESEVDQS